ncbi:MAG: hypothetical protein KIY09_06780 [Thermoplasmata archaeon]|nr:hypothetical protein [Candidatus Sysuiplasma acidicola]
MTINIVSRITVISIVVLLSISGVSMVTANSITNSAAASTSQTKESLHVVSASRANLIGGSGTTLNWAGYVVATSFSNPQPVISGISGSWVLQKVKPTSNLDQYTYSSQWVGIGGYFSGELIQVGTESDTYSGFFGIGATTYYAWYEMLPYNGQPGNSSEVKIKMAVHPGNIMVAEIFGNNPTWTITIADTNTSGFFQKVFTYNTDMKSGDFIDERPTVNGGLPTLANFGTAYFGPAYAGSGNYNTVTETDGNVYFLGSNGIQNVALTMDNSSGNVLAQPSSLNNDLQSFTVTWKRGS